jgi:hypothetical protein
VFLLIAGTQITSSVGKVALKSPTKVKVLKTKVCKSIKNQGM